MGSGRSRRDAYFLTLDKQGQASREKKQYGNEDGTSFC